MGWSTAGKVVREKAAISPSARAPRQMAGALLVILVTATPGPAALASRQQDLGAEAFSRTRGAASSRMDETVPVAATGKAYYVAQDGNDGNDGLSPTTAWATIQKAADTLLPGETVIVLPGDYTDLKVIVKRSGADGAPIVFQAQGTVTTQGFIVSADYITIKGFDVSDTNDHRVNGSPTHDSRGGTGILVSGSFCDIEDNYVHFSVWGGIILYKSGDTSAPSHCIVRNNRLFKNGMEGLEVQGRSNLIEGNEIWGTIQHHPDNVEHASETYLDADGIRFFGQGHVIRENYIHDIRFGPAGVNPEQDDYNDDPHIDCFQTWTGPYYETAKDILFERNWCDNAQGQTANETGQGFMIEGPPPYAPSGLIVRNNVIRAYRCMNVLDATGIVIVNNTCVNDPSLPTTFHPSGVGLHNSPGATIKNNLFYDITVHTIILGDAVSQTAETGKNLSYRSDGKPLVINDSYYDASRRANDLWGIDPLLADPQGQPPDYHLTPGSPAVDAGYDLGSMLPDDYDGITRPQLGGFDIGAFEYPEPAGAFADVPPSHPYYVEIEWLHRNGYTAGCAVDPLRYCPDDTMNRAESAVFVERGIHSATYEPPTPATQLFADLALDSWAAKWVNGLWQDHYTAGCGTNPLIYCPWQGHTRAEGGVFYLRMMKGASYEPPQPLVQTFSDVPLSAWYAKWAQAAYEAGLITPCQSSAELKFCPDDPLSRGLAAYMMVKAKAEPAPGRSFYVSPGGNDGDPGTLQQPWRTIQKAADTMVGGDTTTVLAGDYSAERIDITKSGASGLPITFKAEGVAVTRGFNITASYVTIAGFEVANSGYQKAGVFVKGAHNIIENNYIHDAGLVGILLYGYLADQTTTVTHDNIVRNNRLYHNENAGMNINGRNNLVEGNEVWGTQQCLPVANACHDADGILFFGQGHVFRRNYIHDILFGPPGVDPAIGDYNDNPHIDCFQTWADLGGQWSEQASNILFEQNYCDNLQFQNDYEKGQGWMVEGNAHHITIRNNIIRSYRGINNNGGTHTQANHLYIYNNLFVNDLAFPAQPDVAELYNATYSIIRNNIFYDQRHVQIDLKGDTTGIDIDYNLTYNSDGSQPIYLTNAPHELRGINPLFVNPAAQDYHLQAGSPAIDAGITLPDMTNDYDGILRPQGTGLDIGPFEYHTW